LILLEQLLELADLFRVLALEQFVHVQRFGEQVADRRRDGDARNGNRQQDPRIEERDCDH
jgi:hypothetical protein